MSTTIDDISELEDILGEMRFAVRDRDYVKPLQAISDDLEEQHDKMFQEGREASGEPWKPLKPRTISNKGHGIILFEFEDLWKSLVGNTEDSIREIHEQEMTWGTADPKARFHQEGTAHMPARPPVGISDETLDRAAEHVADHVVQIAAEAFDEYF